MPMRAATSDIMSPSVNDATLNAAYVESARASIPSIYQLELDEVGIDEFVWHHLLLGWGVCLED